MGANAQTTVQKFVSGAVLTAAQQNTSAATGVPVFATTVTRDAAFGGSNKVLAEGQTCYLEDTNVVQYYDGAAWATVGPSAAVGFVTITAKTAFTTSNQVEIKTFSAAYDYYKIFFVITASSAAGVQQVRLGTTGAPDTSANYYGGFLANSGAGATEYLSNAGGTIFSVGRNYDIKAIGAGEITVFEPFAATRTRIDSTMASLNASGGGFTTYIGGGVLDVAASQTRLFLIPASGTITGYYTVYGISQ